MKLKDLEKFRHIYSDSKIYGSNKLLNEFLHLKESSPVPLSLSHGVDFEHCYQPMDINSIAPIHWAYNQRLLERSVAYKPTLLAPHPWAIAVSSLKLPTPNKSALLIGPPPGKSNDLLLFNKIKNKLSSDYSILVKKGEHQSMEFWRKKGIQPITAGDRDNDDFYKDLALLLSQYETIIGCTFSSALIFAASLGKKVEFIEGYYYTAYDSPVYLDEIVNFNSEYAKSFVSQFYNGTREEVTELAKQLLGFDLLADMDRVKKDYLNLIENLDYPVLNKGRENNNLLTYNLKILLAKILTKPNIVNNSMNDIRSKLKKKIFKNSSKVVHNDLIVKQIDEISVWLDGINDKNLYIYNTPYIEGITIQGTAVDKY